MAAAHDGDELIGRRLGEVELVELIDRGGQGAVYRAIQRGLGREVAVKIVQRGEVGPAAIQRFLRETRLAARLDHPYAAHTYASGAEPDGVLWVAMELVRGRSLGDAIASEGPLPLDRLVPLLERIAEVVHTAHEQGIVHRDLKPANVLLVTRAGRLLPKLVDFGIARATEEPGDPAAEVAPTDDLDALGAPPAMTRTGAVLGSPAYMAPEQWYAPSSVGPGADIYALAALTFQALTGHPPFDESNLVKMARAHATQPVPPLPPALPEALHAVIARGMAKRREDRYATALELAAAVRAVAGVEARGDAGPALDEVLADAYVADAPQPMAEAAAALEVARDADQRWTAAWALVDTTLHWLGVVALACRARIGPGTADAEADRARDLIGAAHHRDLAPEEWLALVRAIAAPFHARPEVFPLPELVTAFAPRDPDALAALPELRAAGAATGDDGPARRRDAATELLATLTALLRAARFVLAYPVVVSRGGAAERWSGTRRAPRAVLDDAAASGEGEATMFGADGRPVLVLAPLVRIAPPAPGAADEMFLFAGRGRRGLALRAPPTGFELPDEPLVAWYGRHLAQADAAAADAERAAERSPYKGLATFAPEDALVFFGRERETAAILNQLRVRPLLVIVGPSGTGKSSLVQAGVVPALPARWRTITLRPGATPVATLGGALAGDGVALAVEAAPADLAAALRAAAPIVLVVDQLEELFTLCHDPQERARFAELVVGAAPDPAQPVRVILTLRDDFLVRAEQLAAFRHHLAPGLTVLATPSRGDLLRILEEPARRAGYELDDGLATQMVEAVADQPGALPLLSFTAARLWELRDRQLRRLTRRAHDALGGVGGALGKHAEDTLAAMTPAEAAVVREAFRHLVTGEGTRAVITRGELVDLLAQRAGGGEPRRTAEAVIEHLVAARLLVGSEGAAGDGAAGDGATAAPRRDAERLEVIHEALLASWPRLAGWQRQDAESVRLRDQLRAAARQWDARGRPRGLLWRGDALLELRLWRSRYAGAITSVEEAFRAASIADDARGRRIRRALAIGAFAVLAAGAAALWRMNTRAARSAALAHHQLVAGYLEQGRKELEAGSPSIAALYLTEALRGGADPPVVRRLLGRAFDTIDLAIAATRAHPQPVRWLVPGAAASVVSIDEAGGIRGFSAPGRVAWRRDLATPVRAAAGSPDRAVVAIAGDAGAIWLVATADGAARQVPRHAGPIRALGFGADGVVYSGGDDGVLAETNAATATTGRAVRAGDAPIRALGVTPGGVLTGSGAGELAMWDAGALAARWRIAVGTAPIRAIAMTPDRRTVLAADEDGLVSLVDAATGRVTGGLRGHTGAIIGLAVSRDGALAGTAGLDGTARIFDLATGRQLHAWAHRAAVVTTTFTADGAHALTISVDAGARRWDLASGRLAALYEGHTAGVFASAELADATVVTAGGDGTVRWWRGRDRLHQRAWPLGDGITVGVDWAPDATRVVGGDDHGRLAVWDVATGAAVWQRAAHAQPIWAARFAPDGQVIATASDDGTVGLWAAADGRPLRSIPIGAPVVAAAFAADGALYAAALDGRVLRVDGAAPTPVPVTHAAASFGLDVRAGRIATGSDDHHAKVTDLATGQLLFDRADEREVNAVALSPDGAVIAYGGHAGRVQLAEVATGRPIASLEGRADSINEIELSADGALVVTATVDGAITLWDRTGKPLIRLSGAGQAFARIAPGGGAVVSGGEDGRVRIWSIAPEPRSLDELDAALACRVGYALVDQRLVLRRPGCLAEE